ncbi:hypothetical protein E2320_022856, partial [Naja naja]
VGGPTHPPTYPVLPAAAALISHPFQFQLSVCPGKRVAPPETLLCCPRQSWIPDLLLDLQETSWSSFPPVGLFPPSGQFLPRPSVLPRARSLSHLPASHRSAGSCFLSQRPSCGCALFSPSQRKADTPDVVSLHLSSCFRLWMRIINRPATLVASTVSSGRLHPKPNLNVSYLVVSDGAAHLGTILCVCVCETACTHTWDSFGGNKPVRDVLPLYAGAVMFIAHSPLSRELRPDVLFLFSFFSLHAQAPTRFLFVLARTVFFLPLTIQPGNGGCFGHRVLFGVYTEYTFGSTAWRSFWELDGPGSTVPRRSPFSLAPSSPAYQDFPLAKVLTSRSHAPQSAAAASESGASLEY